PDTLVFRKGRGLYGIDLAREAIRRADQAVITEGYTDVIMAHQRGFHNVVASMGTSLTEDQIGSLKRLTRRLVLALDADQAGVSAAERGLEVAMEALRGRPAPVPLAKNLVRFESRLEAEIEIALLPAGKDPDELLRRDSDAWSRLIEGALPILDYHLAQAASKWDLETARGKAAAARVLLPLIDELGPGIQRAHYLQRLARLLQVEERRLEDELSSADRATRRADEPETESQGPLSGIPGYTFGPERRLLGLLLEAPARLEVVNGVLAQMGIALLEDSDFDEVENREIFAALVRSGAEASWSEIPSSLPDALHEAYISLMGLRRRTEALSRSEDVAEAIHCALRLRDRRLSQEIERLQFLLTEDAEARHELTEAVMGRGVERTRIKKAWSRGIRLEGEELGWSEASLAGSEGGL
ncbi:MAG: toprim domain-containing protein, partial [Anaerolineae bacterium]